MGIPWKKLLQFILALVLLIIMIIKDYSFNSTMGVTILITFIYLTVIVILCIISKFDMIAAMAVVASDISLGYLLIVFGVALTLENIIYIISVILGALLLIFAFF